MSMIDLVQSRCHEGSPVGKRSLRWEVLTQYTNVMHKRKNVKQIDKNQEDREFCLELFNKVLRIPIVEEDMKRFVRLGKAD